MTLAITLSYALAECLEAIGERGESIEKCLRRFPKHRRELRPLLEMVLALQAERGEEKQPSPMFVLGLKERLIGKADE